MNSMSTIREFLGQKRLAMVGVSRESRGFSRTLYRELRQQGYDVIAVNPSAQEIEGQACYAHLDHIEPPVENVLLMTSAEVTNPVAHECPSVGVKRVWMYRAGRHGGAVNPEAIAFCRQNGIAVIAGECPFMFLPHSAWFHRFHGWIHKIAGAYPN
jgi:predicted CoA-binding protein